MQSPNEITPPYITPQERAEQLRWRAIAIFVMILLPPVVIALWCYLMSVAAHNYHAMLAAFTGAT